MIGLLCFVLAVLASPFKSKLRLEAENAVLRHSESTRRSYPPKTLAAVCPRISDDLPSGRRCSVGLLVNGSRGLLGFLCTRLINCAKQG
jgi:hypothetical protein